jgi:23S rRNA (uracil-5-)-methyltransferase RumA
VDRCGGCPWQHLAYDTQLEAKRQALVDAFERIAEVENPPVGPIRGSPLQVGYRNRLKLRFAQGRLGFYSAHTHELVPVTDCLVAEERIRRTLPEVQRFIASLDTEVLRVEIASRGQLAGVVLAINSRGRLRRADVHRAKQFLSMPHAQVTGIVMWGKGWAREWGDTRRRFAIDEHGFSIESAGGAFGQVNEFANRLLVETVLQVARLSGPESILDLYAGAGNLSIPLAQRCRTVNAVESDPAAAEAGRTTARYHHMSGIEFHTARVEQFLSEHGLLRPDLVVVNPPRSGLNSAAALVAALRAPRLIYVSCNPATLARDFKVLLAAGYRLSSVSPIDLFPHTFHVESVCDAELT